MIRIIKLIITQINTWVDTCTEHELWFSWE